MGRVLLARDPVLNRDVAIKILRDDLGIPPEVREALLLRMRHEAQAAARVTHPNLVTLHDMGEDEHVALYLVFEFIDGPNLKERLKAGRLPPHQAARLSRELGGALAHAHLAGVLHRDVKPENVMLAPTGAKLSDFGIARIPDSTLTRAGSLIGTPAYCAPEALATGAFSPESDQFSLAATLYEAVSGERAFPGDDAVMVSVKIANDEPRPIARRYSLPDEVDDILLRALEKDPRDRFASTLEFGEALANALERAISPGKPSGNVTAEKRPIASIPPGPVYDRTRVVIGGVAIAIVSSLVGYAASKGTPFFGSSMPIVSAPTASMSAPSASVSATTKPTHVATQPKPKPSSPTKNGGVDTLNDTLDAGTKPSPSAAPSVSK